MSCVHSTPAQDRSRGRAPLFLIQEFPRLPGFPSDVFGIMTQRSDSARPRPYAELDQALHTLGGGYVLLCTCICATHSSPNEQQEILEPNVSAPYSSLAHVGKPMKEGNENIRF